MNHDCMIQLITQKHTVLFSTALCLVPILRTAEGEPAAVWPTLRGRADAGELVINLIYRAETYLTIWDLAP